MNIFREELRKLEITVPPRLVLYNMTKKLSAVQWRRINICIPTSIFDQDFQVPICYNSNNGY